MELTDPRAIRELLARHGFSFTKSMGQNFLAASWVPRASRKRPASDRATACWRWAPVSARSVSSSPNAPGALSAWSWTAGWSRFCGSAVLFPPTWEILFADALRLDLGALARERFPGSAPRRLRQPAV